MKDLTLGKEQNVILKFATPMLLGNLFQQTHSIVDSIIVGRFIGDEAQAAIGASFPLIFALISFTIGIASGGTIIISQYYGAKDYTNVRRAIDTIFIFLFFASILISVIGIIFSRDIFTVTHLPSEVIPLATTYLNTILMGTILFFGFNGISSILRGIGDSKTPLYFLIISSVLNIILDILFIKVFGMGIRGAAIASVASQGTTFIAATIYLNRNHKLVGIIINKLSFNYRIFLQCVRIGIPSGFQQTFVAFGMIALYSIVNLFDTDVIAAYSIAGRIDGLAMLPAMTFGQALSTFVGQNLGAGRTDRIKKGLIATLLMSLFLSVIVTTTVIFFRYGLMSIFTISTEVVKIGAGYLVIVSSAYIIFSIMFALNGVMRGAGDTLIPMFITLFSLWIIRIPFAATLSGRLYDILINWGVDINLPEILTGRLGETGIWLSVPIAWACGAICSFFYYLSGNWKKKGIIKQT